MLSGSDIWNYFPNLIQLNGKPSDCVKCGKCEQRCPQKLQIRDFLDQVKTEVEDKFA